MTSARKNEQGSGRGILDRVLEFILDFTFAKNNIKINSIYRNIVFKLIKELEKFYHWKFQEVFRELSSSKNKLFENLKKLFRNL